MTIESTLEMQKMAYEVTIKELTEVNEDYRHRLLEITDILETVDKAYEDALTKDVTYKHTELWDNDGWGYTAWSIASKVKYGQ